MKTKLQITPASEHTERVLQQWADLEGRTVSQLAAFLMELGLAKAESEGMMPQPVADALRFRS